MSIYFIVTDATHPIVSVSAMRKTGYGITVDHKQTLLTYMGHPRAELHDAHGLYFLWPMDRRDAYDPTTASLIAPVVRGAPAAIPTQDAPASATTTTTTPTATDDVVMDSEATSAPTFTPTGLRRSGHDDYWIITDDYAVRVHKRPRKSLYVPSLSTTGGTGPVSYTHLTLPTTR